MMNLVGAFLVLTGCFFVAVAGVGLVRMKDTLTRMQAASKAATMGVMLMGIGTCLQNSNSAVVVRLALLILLLLITTPVATHAIGGVYWRAGKHAVQKKNFSET